MVDESGFMLAPTVRRTWAPKGQTPIQYSWARRGRLSAISAISVSPERHRLGLYFSIQDDNIRLDDFEEFVSLLLEHFPKGIILVLDRSLVHRWAERRLRKRFSRRIDIEWFPAYAPELNPVEQVWNHSKYSELANYIPDDVLALEKAVCKSINHIRSQKSLLCSFFKKAGLKI
ncbi:MAG TPA: transposase [Anaerohalosphaeraceae bacterium]|nr:transposase [Anaerohalosphaeraceae bacterium]HRU78854.1 transposase [Rectinema sp.]